MLEETDDLIEREQFWLDFFPNTLNTMDIAGAVPNFCWWPRTIRERKLKVEKIIKVKKVRPVVVFDPGKEEESKRLIMEYIAWQEENIDV